MKSIKEKKYDVVDLARSIEEDEYDLVIKHIHGPNPKKTTLLKKLFKVLRITSDKSEIWKSLFPDQGSFDESKDPILRKLNTLLKKNLEDFLVLQNVNRNRVTRNLFLLRELRERQVNRQFVKIQRATQHKINSTSSKDSRIIRKEYELSLLNQHFAITSDKTLTKEDFKRLNGLLDLSWVLERMINDIGQLDFEKNHGISPEENGDETLDQIIYLLYQDDAIKASPLIPLYDIFRRFYKNKDVDIFKLWDIFKKDFLFLDLINATNLFSVILNACIYLDKKTNEKRYLTLLLELYNWGIENKILLVDGILSNQHYKNHITCCIRLNLFELAKEKITSLKKLLSSEHQESYYNFCLGFLQFKKGDYKKSIRLMAKSYPDIYLEIQARFIHAQCWFEIDEGFDINRLLISLKAFIKNQKSIPADKRKGYVNRAQLFIKLLRISPTDPAKLAALRQEIIDTSPLTNPDWLLKKTIPKKGGSKQAP